MLLLPPMGFVMTRTRRRQLRRAAALLLVIGPTVILGGKLAAADGSSAGDPSTAGSPGNLDTASLPDPVESVERVDRPGSGAVSEIPVFDHVEATLGGRSGSENQLRRS